MILLPWFSIHTPFLPFFHLAFYIHAQTSLTFWRLYYQYAKFYEYFKVTSNLYERESTYFSMSPRYHCSLIYVNVNLMVFDDFFHIHIGSRHCWVGILTNARAECGSFSGWAQ
jgi:hypothetical protein